MADTIWKTLIDKFETEVEVLQKHLATGRCTGFEEYKDVCGAIRGLRIAQKLTDDLSRAYMEDGDNE